MNPNELRERKMLEEAEKLFDERFERTMGCLTFDKSGDFYGQVSGDVFMLRALVVGLLHDRIAEREEAKRELRRIKRQLSLRYT